MAGNANSGRRRRPTAFQAPDVHPNRVNREEPKLQVGEPAHPPMTTRAAEIWAELAPGLIEAGVLTVGDGRSFGALCGLLSVLDAITAEKNAPTFTLLVMKSTVDGDGNVHLEARENPLLRMERQTLSAVRPYLALFGLEPSSRARLKTANPPKTSPLEQFIASGFSRG